MKRKKKKNNLSRDDVFDDLLAQRGAAHFTEPLDEVRKDRKDALRVRTFVAEQESIGDVRLTEEEYWLALEYRVCRELRGMDTKAVRSLWCDGFIPGEWAVLEPRPRITGSVWMGRGRNGQACWEFELSLGRSFPSREDIPWKSLLPADEDTGWLDVDLDQGQLRIRPIRPVG